MIPFMAGIVSLSHSIDVHSKRHCFLLNSVHTRDLKQTTNAQIGRDVENKCQCMRAFHDFSITVCDKIGDGLL